MRLMHGLNFLDKSIRTNDSEWVAYIARNHDSGDGHLDRTGIITDTDLADAWTHRDYDLTNLQAMQLAATAIIGSYAYLSYSEEHIGRERAEENRAGQLLHRSNYSPYAAMMILGASGEQIDTALGQLVANSRRKET